VFKDNIIKLFQPEPSMITEILRTGARTLLAQKVEAGVADALGKHADLKTSDGHRRIVRRGYPRPPDLRDRDFRADLHQKAIVSSATRHIIYNYRKKTGRQLPIIRYV